MTVVAHELHRSQASPETAPPLDWKLGGVVYQIFVDRFKCGGALADKCHLYAHPRKLREWHELPAAGSFVDEEKNHSAELHFWGGDLAGVTDQLDYLRDLGVETVYLNPIFEAFTNHKYDAINFFAIDPQFGTQDDLRHLVSRAHQGGMRVMLDGVLNHMGRRSPLFQRAAASADSAERDFFTFSGECRHGYLGWRNSANLPELRLENPDVADFLFRTRESVVQSYLRDFDIDGWRLDVAPDLGFRFLRQITDAAHAAKADSAVIGECWNYPEGWLDSVDGILNMFNRNLILEFIGGKISPSFFARIWNRMLGDCDFQGLLRSHLVLDNHDVPRLATLVPDLARRNICRALQFTLPGCPVIYYGSELGMEGGADPTNRAPMRWDLLHDNNLDFQNVRQLLAIRRENRALRDGDMRMLDSERTFAFIRRNDDPRQSVIVVVNGSDQPVTDIMPVRDSRLMDAAPLRCMITGEQVVVHSGLLEVHVPALTVMVFRTVDRGNSAGYTMFKRSNP